MARPAKPMFALHVPAAESECDLGALDYTAAAQFLGISTALLRKLVERRELLPVYEGTKPRILKRHLQDRLDRQLAKSLAERGPPVES